MAARVVVAGLLVLVLLITWRRAHRAHSDLALLSWAVLPLAAYLLLSPTVHPWYVTLVVPWFPFLAACGRGGQEKGRFLLAGLYFAAAAVVSYLTYLDPVNLREYGLVRLLEYLPLYGLLLWAAWRTSGGAGSPGKS
jgi:hypothetical protein